MNRKLFLMAIIVCVSLVKVRAQVFEGVVTYAIAYNVNEADRFDLEMYRAMLPEKLELSLKGANAMMKCTGGSAQALLGDILYRSQEKNIYALYPQSKTASLTSVHAASSKGKTVLKAEKTDETNVLLGHACTKYVVKDQQGGTETEVWCSKIGQEAGSLMHYFLETMAHYRIEGLQGLPLKIAFKSKEFNLSIVSEQIEKKPLETIMFAVPKDYTIMPAN